MLPKKYDFKKIEEDVTRLWDENGVREKAIAYDPGKKLFSFLEGPPTANAPPGLHHVEVRVFKDLFCRYRFMQGYTVPRKGGWDCHGLPVEVQIEKKLGLNSKQDILKFGIDKFNAMCRTDVFNYIKDWNAMTKKTAYWVDLENAYVTLNNNYIESVWWSLKELFNKSLLYQGYKVVPYCPRCQTPLSSHEVALGYEDVTEETVTCRFRLKDSEKRYFLAWTTTPWTLPSNLALAVHPDVAYAIVEHEGSEYVLAKELIGSYFEDGSYRIIDEVKGAELEGIGYEPLFDYAKGKLEEGKRAFIVITADYVTTGEGTGIVHQAPAFGEDDYNACMEKGIGFFHPVDETGRFTDEVPDFRGMAVKEADRHIIDLLESRGVLFEKHEHTHTYPFCWRCKTALIYFAAKSWFVRVSSFRDKLVEFNNQISWFPEHIKQGRFGNWIEGAKDWALSRSKFWGTPLPIWTCNCGHRECIGSIEELREKAGSLPEELDLHKPMIDEIRLKCPECGSEMSRDLDVIDCWYDSGSAIFAQFHYPFENKELFKKRFPYDFIAEAIDQTRGWFYTLHVLGALLFDQPAYRNVVCAGHVVDENGEKMSKSKGNILNPWEVFERVGVDAVRLQMCSTSPGDAKRFGYQLINEGVMPFLTILWNCCRFADEFLEMQGIAKRGVLESRPRLKAEDRWIISCVNSTLGAVQDALEKHEYNNCLREIITFANESLSRWYIKLIRDRADSSDDALAYTLLYVIDRLAHMLAPFAPYTTDYIYRFLLDGRCGSIHLSSWPNVEAVDEALEEEMSYAQGIVQAVRKARDSIGVGIRWPLAEAVVVGEACVKKALASFYETIANQVNVRDIRFEPDFKADPIVKADYAKMKPVFGEMSARIIAQMVTHSPKTILSHLEKEGFFEVAVGKERFRVLREHVIVEKQPPEGYAYAQAGDVEVYISKAVSPELESEGFSREVARRVQSLRKKAGLNKADRISLFIQTDQGLKEMLEPWKKQLASKTGASGIVIASTEPGKSYEHRVEEKVKGHSVRICFLTEKFRS
ncbi:isoleucine--tRNA ligase [Candidatus Woesearchaeota archaeon CG08_land_8_20_14_0_20_47_9]|nr:MAG: isoleucine--tRNA ligase [Candidatus Woesearchaeota archaeon CG08_land_8_20_14_0_20_47_9]